ncbi:MAG: hypothetical protein AB1429_00250 [Pseudomonadota bacterium]|jgi:hypothetical protein
MANWTWDKPRPKRPFGVTGWIGVALIPISFVALAAVLRREMHIFPGLAILTGYACGSALVVWGVCCALAGRRLNIFVNIIHYVALAGMAFVVLFAQQRSRWDLDAQQMAHAQSAVRDASVALLSGKGDIHQDNVGGDAGLMQRVIENQLQRLHNASAAAESEMAAQSPATVLATKGIDAPGALEGRLLRVRKIRKSIVDFTAEQDRIVGLTRNEIQELPIPEVRRQAFLRNYLASVATDKPKGDAIWKQRLAVVDQEESLLLMLQRRRAQWRVIPPNAILFDNPALASEYNRRVRQLKANSAAAEEDAEALKANALDNLQRARRRDEP